MQTNAQVSSDTNRKTQGRNKNQNGPENTRTGNNRNRTGSKSPERAGNAFRAHQVKCQKGRMVMSERMNCEISSPKKCQGTSHSSFQRKSCPKEVWHLHFGLWLGGPFHGLQPDALVGLAVRLRMCRARKTGTGPEQAKQQGARTLIFSIDRPRAGPCRRSAPNSF